MKNLVSFLSWPVWAPTVTIIIGILCVIPSENVPPVSGDKTAHIVSFGVATFFWLIRYPKLYTLLFLCFLGIAIEYIQKMLPPEFHRGFEYLDMVADFKGVIIGYLFFKMYEKLVLDRVRN